MNQHNEMTRIALIEKADTLLSHYPQYKKYHDNWILVRCAKSIMWKSGAKMGEGDITIGYYERDILDYSGRWIIAVFTHSCYGWTVYHCTASTSQFFAVL